MNTGSTFWPQGTVYGSFLNSPAELTALGNQVHQAPYQAPPVAPVLYIKPANTWARSGEPLALPASVPQVEVGASVAMVIGAPAFGPHTGRARPTVAGFVLVNDLSVPHSSFFRPPVKFKCLDGFLRLGPVCVPLGEARDPAGFEIEVRVNDVLQQTVSFGAMARDATTLLADVSAFMALRAGDLLLLGCGAGRPLAGPGDRIDIRMCRQPHFGSLSTPLVQAAREAA